MAEDDENLVLVIVELIASSEGKDAVSVPSLAESVDVDALKMLVETDPTAGAIDIEFSHMGYRIMVGQDSPIKIQSAG